MCTYNTISTYAYPFRIQNIRFGCVKETYHHLDVSFTHQKFMCDRQKLIILILGKGVYIFMSNDCFIKMDLQELAFQQQ